MHHFAYETLTADRKHKEKTFFLPMTILFILGKEKVILKKWKLGLLLETYNFYNILATMIVFDWKEQNKTAVIHSRLSNYF